MVAPFWALGAGVGLIELRLWLRSMRIRAVFDCCVAVALMSAFGVSILGRTLIAVVTWGERDVTAYYASIRRVIPEGRERVYGDYRLLFLAREAGWRFIARYYPAAEVKGQIDYVVLSELTEAPAWLDMKPYELVATIGNKRIDRHGIVGKARNIFGEAPLPLSFRIYKARSSP